jgi:signal transduction histidine kinase/DNA-binding response OmpR family regulator
MLTRLFHKVDLWVVRSVISTGDNKEILLRKKIWWGLVLCFAFFFLNDFIISLKTNEGEMILLNASGFLICIALLVIFYFHRKAIDNYGLFLQFFIIIEPAIKVYLLGGLFNSYGIAIVGLIGPIYALTFPYYKRAVLVFGFYLSLMIGFTILYELIAQSELIYDTYFYYSLIRFSGATIAVFFLSMIYSFQIAKLKSMEEERLKQLNHAKSKLYTNITHEFRTPLTVILGMADNIRDNKENLLYKGLNLIKNNANKLLKLVNQLLNMSKIEADSMPVNMIQSDIKHYIRYIIESFHSIAEEKNIRLHFLTDQDKLVIDFDPDIIEEILSNLLSNAVKYTPANGDVYIQLETKLKNDKESAEYLIINVRDNGIGIAEDKLPNIFDRFYQADDESTRKAEGAGIGLALVKEYLNLINGTIHVKSKVGKGTEFILNIPVTKDAPLERADYKTTKKKDALITESSVSSKYEPVIFEDLSCELPLVLIVEDNNDVVEYLKSVLINKYYITVASDGNQGINEALEKVPDIIICDVMMPEKDGYEVCRTLKEDFRTNHIPIIMLTAKADTDSKITGLEYGADAYIIKPFNKKELLIRINKLIENRQKLKDKYSKVIFSASDAKKPKGLNEIFLHKLTGNLEMNYQDESYSIERLCVDTGTSRTQLHRKLLALTGKTTSDFIRHFRIIKAKELLLTSDFNVSEIAYHVGFKDPNYFTKSFTKETGITPSRFRSENTAVKQ